MELQPGLAGEPLQTQEKWQVNQLRKLVGYLQQHSPYYKKLLEDHCVPDAKQITSLRDLEAFPITTKRDLQEHNQQFLCVPRNQIREYTTTSGTLGKPVTISLTENDLKRLAYNEEQSFRCAGVQPADVVQLMLTLDRQFMAGIAYYLGLHQLGAATVRTGPGLPPLQWDAMSRYQSDVLVAVPSFLMKIIDWAEQEKKGLSSTKVRKAICIGETIRNGSGALNTLGSKIKQHWNIELLNTYAATEMQTAFTECRHVNGVHHQPDLIIFEILDEQDKQLEAGAYGELTITTLGVEGMPLLRYRTGDVCCFYEEPCGCGRMSRRLSPLLGRKKQMIKYKGTTLYPAAIFEVLNDVDFVSDYVIEATTNDLGNDDLRIHLTTQLEHDDCARRLRPLLQSRLRVVADLKFHSSQSLQQLLSPPNARKQQKFLDNREVPL